MSKITYTIEVLHHFSCYNCGGWWSVSDPPRLQEWTCPRCGFKATAEKEDILRSESETVELKLRSLSDLGKAMADVLELIRKKKA